LNDAKKYRNPKKKIMNRLVHSQGTQKNTHTLLFGKIQRKTETPSLAPYSFPPSPFLLGIRIFNYPPDLKNFQSPLSKNVMVYMNEDW
jgi:hypothetical protein